MKYLAVFILFICLPITVFSQDAKNQRFQALSDAMANTVTTSTSNLEHYDDLIHDDGNTKNYLEYARKHRSLLKALNESETRLNFSIRTNGAYGTIRDERNKYEGLVHQAEDLKANYDEWLKNVR